MLAHIQYYIHTHTEHSILESLAHLADNTVFQIFLAGVILFAIALIFAKANQGTSKDE